MARLHHELVTTAGAAIRGVVLITHGIFGSGANWRSIARKVHGARPELGCVLVDLRNHGRSESPPPPHDLAACADDLGVVVDLLSRQGPAVIAAVGHSFGGKVVATLRQRRAHHQHVAELRQWWMLDASPSGNPAAWTEPGVSARDVLETLEALPATFASRDEFERAVTAAGHASSLAKWLGLSLVADGAALRLRLPLPAMREMLSSYWATDLWSSLREPAGDQVHVVVAERSRSLSPADRAALATSPPHLRAHTVAADHWLHIEAPDAVVGLLTEHLPSPG